MSKIKFEHIDENEIAVHIDSNVPLDMVEQLTKNLESKGMIEDKFNSSITCRFFYRAPNRAGDIADELIKSLQIMAKAGEDESPYSKEVRVRTAERNRINDRRAKAKLPSMTDAQVAASKPKAAPVAPKAPDTQVDVRPFGSKPKTLFDPQMSGKVNYKKSEDEDEDDVEKSNYGPKKGGQYTAADNARRKSNNMDPVGVGPNVNAKSFSTKPGQLSSKQSADLTARIQNKANKKQPVKTFTPEEIAAKYNPDGTLKKTWGQHLPFPHAEEEIAKLAKRAPSISGEDAAAHQLAALMAGKSLLGDNVPAAVRARFAAPPAQPTDEQMFGHLVVTEEMEKANNQKWQGAAFDWLAEAAKPITQKFNSEEEELAYWKSIKVSDKDDGQAGY